MKYLSISIAIAFGLSFNSYGQSKADMPLKQQAERMGQAFISGDYKTFAHYTCPIIVKAMGGEEKMAAALTKITDNMKMKGMSFIGVTFGEVSKIVKEGGAWQCTLPQHTEIKMPDGRVISTSTLIAISTDEGVHWTFLDTSNKDMATIRKILPNLSSSISIPEQQPPVRYDH